MRTSGKRNAKPDTKRRVTPLEMLEQRELLTATTETFVGPNLNPLLKRSNPGPAIINKMTVALQTQITNGPLADLKAGKVDSTGFVTEVQSLAASYVNYSDSKLAKLPSVKEVVNLQSARAVADQIAIEQSNSVGLVSDATYISVATTAVNSLTKGPILPNNTPVSNLLKRTNQFIKQVDTIVAAFGNGALKLSDAANSIIADAEAYRTDMHSAILVGHPIQSNDIDGDVIRLENAAANIVATNNAKLSAGQLIGSVNTFYNGVIDIFGTFGPRGPVAKALREHGWPQTPTILADDTTLTDVSATGSAGGLLVLSATLTENTSTNPAPNQLVVFTVNGDFAGTAITDNDGLATIAIANTLASGSTTGGVVASFAGDAYHRPTAASGDVSVTKATSALSAVSGSAQFGGTATLTATLANTTTNTPLSGQTINFTLDGTAVGSAVTNASGVATLSGVASSKPVGTDTGGVVASYAGSSAQLPATNVSGNLVTTTASTTFGTINGTAVFGGLATLHATLISAVTNQPIPNATVSFTLDGIAVGTGVTDANGIATATATTTANAGTDAGGIVVSFAGNSNFAASGSATGSLVVSQAGTSLGSVSGTGNFGGPATLTATLTSAATNSGVSGQVLNFTLNGVAVGSATTNSSGVATFTGVSNTLPAGTTTGIVGVTFPGTTNFLAAPAATGNITISQAATTLGSVGGTADFGGTATLHATLTSLVTNLPVAGETVVFSLNGVQVGTAVTNASGVATLSGVANANNAGTDTGGVTANYTGTSNYTAATKALGDLVVNKAGTSFTAVSGTAPLGGPATLLATLLSSVTGLGISGETVNFLLDGVAVGSAVTDTNGVATLDNVPTSDGTGTHQGAVVSTYNGSSNYLDATNGSGDLVVS